MDAHSSGPYSQVLGVRIAEETEEKVISRLGITYGVLRRLGFLDELVEKCLRSINSTELEDAFDWVSVRLVQLIHPSYLSYKLYLNCSESELGLSSLLLILVSLQNRADVSDIGDSAPPELKILTGAAGVSVTNDFIPPTPRLLPDPVDEKVDVPQPILVAVNDPMSEQPQHGDQPDDINPHALATDIGASDLNFREEDFDNDDPTIAYVLAKLRHDDLSSKPRSSTSTDYLRKLQKKIDELSKDYLFDAKEAKVRYSQERKKVENKLLQERLLSSSTDRVPRLPNGGKKVKAVAPIPATTTKPEDPDSDDSEGMLGFLDNPDATEVTVKGVTFNLRDMTLPKHWSGPMPKILLRDFVSKKDRYAAISYSILSSHSRARRASLVISWQTKKRDQWSMDEVACRDDTQAEQYIATVALHSLTFPLTEGFSASTPASSSSSTSFRLLPAVYRELWDELEASRKSKEDLVNRQAWAKLRSILEEKALNSSKVSLLSIWSCPSC